MIGRPLRRREDLPLVRGEGRYVDDLDLPGLAHVAFLRSHDARARILGIRVPSSASQRASKAGAPATMSTKSPTLLANSTLRAINRERENA